MYYALGGPSHVLVEFVTQVYDVGEVPGPQSVGGSEICSRVSVEAVWERARRSCVGSVG